GFEPLLSRCKRDAFPVMLPAHFCWLRDTLQRAVNQIKLKLPNDHLVHLEQSFILGVGSRNQSQRRVDYFESPVFTSYFYRGGELNNSLSCSHEPTLSSNP